MAAFLIVLCALNADGQDFWIPLHAEAWSGAEPAADRVGRWLGLLAPGFPSQGCSTPSR